MEALILAENGNFPNCLISILSVLSSATNADILCASFFRADSLTMTCFPIADVHKMLLRCLFLYNADVFLVSVNVSGSISVVM